MLHKSVITACLLLGWTACGQATNTAADIGIFFKNGYALPVQLQQRAKAELAKKGVNVKGLDQYHCAINISLKSGDVGCTVMYSIGFGQPFHSVHFDEEGKIVRTHSGIAKEDVGPEPPMLSSLPLSGGDAITNGAPKVAITNLLAHMKDYYGKRIEVTGYYKSGPELLSIYQNKEEADAYRNTQALYIMPFVKKSYEERVKFIKQGTVRIIGVFDYNFQQPKLGVGHANQWPAQIVALELFQEIK